MHAFSHWLLIGLLCFAGSARPLSAEGTGKPNLIYILTDQWRASATGYAGDPNVKTPYLDKLAKQSLEMTNAVSVLPVCTPYRAALLTGRYPTSTGMFLNDVHLPDEELCMAEIFRPAGYTTAYLGKWHLDGHGRAAFIPPARRQGWEYWKAAECDHDYARSHYYTGDSPEKQYWSGFDSIAQTKDAQDYLRARAEDKQPFVLFIAYGPPHFPYKDVPEEYLKLYPPESIQLPPNVPEKLVPSARKSAQGYYAFCTLLDDCIGDLLKIVDETGLAGNSMVVFTSDHGETLGGHDIRPNNKQVAWSESSHVPLLLRVPGVAGRKVSTPITTPDILPTLLGLSGVTAPATIEGVDLSASLKSGQDLDRAALYMGVSPFLGAEEELRRPYRAIRTNRYTYVRDLNGPWLLYDDQQDPHQTRNLLENGESKSLVDALDARLQEELKRIWDGFHPPEWYYKEWSLPFKAHQSAPYAAINETAYTPRRAK